MWARVSSRQSARSRFRWSVSREAPFPIAPDFEADLAVGADLPGLLARAVLLAFAFEAKCFSTDLGFVDFISFRFSK